MSTSTNPRRRSRDSHPLNNSDSDKNSLVTASLPKGATFHSPTSAAHSAFPSPPASPSPVVADRFVPPNFSRSHSSPDDVIDAHRRRAAMILSDVDRFFGSTKEENLTLPPPSKTARLDDILPIPRSFLGLDVIMGETEDQPPRSPRHQTKPKHNHASDSGLGSSIASTKQQQVSEAPMTCSVNASTITRSAAITTMHDVAGLSKKAVNRIHEHILRPLRSKASLKEFEPILLDVPRRIREKDIVCLRDLEKTLWFRAPETTKSSSLYLDFCLTSIRCIQATVEYLSDREQVRPGDRPYTNGYFVDLKDQVFQYASQLAAMKEEEEAIKTENEVDIFDLDPTDEVRLYGGLSKNGRPAELIRVKKDGRAFSLATGEEVDLTADDKEVPFIRMKRSLSAEAEDEEEVMRSMARRKKNAPHEEVIPRLCHEVGCGKKFKRECDLRKHQKTHLRPWKCSVDGCKYAAMGWPTEKELDRHFNDKHSDNPPMFCCKFAPCPYKSKRESNCKQHMEKAHGWVYIRQKTNGKVKSDPPSVYDHSSLSPVSNDPYGAPTPPSEDHRYPHFNQFDYPTYPADQEYMQAPGPIPLSLDDMDFELASAPRQAPRPFEAYGNTFQHGNDFIVRDDLYAAHAHLPSPDPVHFTSAKLQRVQIPTFDPSGRMPPQGQPTAPYTPPQRSSFSPNAETNSMLYTPTSIQDDERAAFEEGYKGAQMPGDFQLFPVSIKTTQPELLFNEVPSSLLSFSQPPSQDLFPAQANPLPPMQTVWNSPPQRQQQYTPPYQPSPPHHHPHHPQQQLQAQFHSLYR
jgi:predicted small metal-binding protein